MPNETIRSVRQAFLDQKRLAEGAVAQLTDAQLHTALTSETNSIAVIMKHVAGNLISRWTDFLTTDGEKPWRNRDDEFVDTLLVRDEPLARWEEGWSQLLTTLDSLTSESLSAVVTIRGEPHSVPLALCRSLAHTSYHVGQIVQAARVLAGGHWETLTIARGDSEAYNRRTWKSAEQRTPED